MLNAKRRNPVQVCRLLVSRDARTYKGLCARSFMDNAALLSAAHPKDVVEITRLIKRLVENVLFHFLARFNVVRRPVDTVFQRHITLHVIAVVGAKLFFEVVRVVPEAVNVRRLQKFGKPKLPEVRVQEP